MKKKQFFPCFLVFVIIANLQSTIAAPAAAAANPPPSSPSSSSPEAENFIRSICNATSPTPQDNTECFKFLAPYAVFINGSRTRAVRASVTVLVAELQALAKNAAEFGLPSKGKCIHYIQDGAAGGRQQLADLARLDVDEDGKKVTDQDLANVNKWYQEVKANMEFCDYDITDVKRSQIVLSALKSLDGLVSSAGKPK